MKKDMEYYIQVSGRIMKDNLDKRKSLTKKICDWYLDQDKEDICLIIEMGFISNEKDVELYDDNMDDYAAAIANGIIEWLNEYQ